MIIVINSQGGLISIQDEDLFQGSTKLNKIDLVAPFADNVIWKANFEMPDGTIKPDNLDGYLFQPSMKIVDNFNVWKLPITFPITQDYGIVTMQLRGYIGDTVVCTTSIKLPIQKGVPYDSDFTEISDKDELLRLISDLRALVNNKADKVSYNYKLAENITADSVGKYFVYDDETNDYKSVTLPQEYTDNTEYYEAVSTARIINNNGDLAIEYTDNTTDETMTLKVDKDKATLNGKQIALLENVEAVDSKATENAYKIDGVINNTIKIGNDTNKSFATKGATAHSAGDIAIGYGAEANFDSIALGGQASNSAMALGKLSKANGNRAVAVGYMAEALRSGAVQLGQGTNNEAYSLKFMNYKLVDMDGKVYTNDGTSAEIQMNVVASQKFVTDLFADISSKGLSLQIVETLPTDNISTNTIYLVSVEKAEGNNYYEEYLYINDRWELIGTTQIDLSEYVKNTDYASANKGGVIKVSSIGGVEIDGTGVAYVSPASKANIAAKTVGVNKPIVPANLDYAVKVGLTTNTETLTEEEKAKAQEWLGVDSSLNAHKQILLGADGVIEENVYNFTVESPESYIEYRTNGTKFLVDLHLPVVGEIDNTKEVAITFGNTAYYVYNILKGTERVTIGDLRQITKYSNATGYRFIVEMTFFENADITGFAIIPTVSISDVLSLTSDEMDAYMAEGGLNNGQLAICKKVITNGYTEGGLYRFDITYPDTYVWTELSSGGGVSEEDFNKLVNNEIQIKDVNNGFMAGNATSVGNQGIAIGHTSKSGMLGVTIGVEAEGGFRSIALGFGAQAKQVSNGSIAIGWKARANNTSGDNIAIGPQSNALGKNSVQIGTGTNSTDNTLQIFNKNIYNHSTDTLTVQNIELNGENLADKLENAGGTNIVSVEDSTITTNKLEKVVHLSEEQYQELIANGSITIGEQVLAYDENTIYVTNDNASPLKELILSGTSVLTSTETFNKHIQIMVEFETDSIHAGFDCVLHPYDEAVCFVTYDVLVNGQANFGTAYLNESGNVVINVPSGLTFSNVHAKYCELNAHSGGGAESGGSAKKYLHNISIRINSAGGIIFSLIDSNATAYTSLDAVKTALINTIGDASNDSTKYIPANGTFPLALGETTFYPVFAVGGNSQTNNYIKLKYYEAVPHTATGHKIINVSWTSGLNVTDTVVEV